MKEFHNFTCLADKDVDLSIGRIATGLSNLTAHCVDPNSHISWGIGEEKLVILVKTEDIHPPKTGISVHFCVLSLMAMQK